MHMKINKTHVARYVPELGLSIRPHEVPELLSFLWGCDVVDGNAFIERQEGVWSDIATVRLLAGVLDLVLEGNLEQIPGLAEDIVHELLGDLWVQCHKATVFFECIADLFAGGSPGA